MAKQAAMMEEKMKKMGKKKPLIKKDGDVRKQINEFLLKIYSRF